MQQAITLANVYPDICSHMMSLGNEEVEYQIMPIMNTKIVWYIIAYQYCSTKGVLLQCFSICQSFWVKPLLP